MGLLTLSPRPHFPLTLCSRPSMLRDCSSRSARAISSLPTKFFRGLTLRWPRGLFSVLWAPTAPAKPPSFPSSPPCCSPTAAGHWSWGWTRCARRRRLRERINLAASSAHFLWCLTVEENLRFYGRQYGMGGRVLAQKGGGIVGTLRINPPPPGHLR